MPPDRQLLERMRSSKAGWRMRDLQALYRGFGFEQEEGSKHTLFIHPQHPELRATVTRSSGELPRGYIVQAVHLIDALPEGEQADGA
jgi:hypothetical protein